MKYQSCKNYSFDDCYSWNQLFKKQIDDDIIGMTTYSNGLILDEHRALIEQLDIPKNAKIISPQNPRKTGAFYLNRMGWTISSIEDVTRQHLINSNKKVPITC